MDQEVTGSNPVSGTIGTAGTGCFVFSINCQLVTRQRARTGVYQFVRRDTSPLPSARSIRTEEALAPPAPGLFLGRSRCGAAAIRRAGNATAKTCLLRFADAGARSVLPLFKRPPSREPRAAFWMRMHACRSDRRVRVISLSRAGEDPSCTFDPRRLYALIDFWPDYLAVAPRRTFRPSQTSTTPLRAVPRHVFEHDQLRINERSPG